MQDRYIKLMLTLVAGLLAANLLHSLSKSDVVLPELFVGSAQAQNTSTAVEVQGASAKPNNSVRSLQGYPVDGLKEVVSLGDGRTFVVSNTKGFMVYQVSNVK